MTQKEKHNVPALRFPEFNGDWQREPLKALSSKSISYGIVQTGSPVEGGVKCVRVIDLTKPRIDLTELITTSERISQSYMKTILIEGEIMVALRGEIGLVAVVPKELEGSNLTRGIARIAPKDSKVHSSYLLWALRSPESRKEFVKQVNGSALKEIPIGGLNKILVQLTTLPEQQKIASFLSAVDEKITQLGQKKELLETYKKGCMQQLFSQEIRFKDNEGCDFPDWEKKDLGELLDYEQPTKYLVESDEYNDEYLTPVLTAGKTFILGYTNENDGIFRNNLPTIIFDDFTTAFKFVDFPFKAKSSAMKMLTLRNSKDNISFIFSAMNQIRFPLGEHKRHWISEYQWGKIPFPHPEEQRKIANFLSAIDTKITLVTEELKLTKIFKKGLLQQMFV